MPFFLEEYCKTQVGYLSLLNKWDKDFKNKSEKVKKDAEKYDSIYLWRGSFEGVYEMEKQSGFRQNCTK